MSPIAAEFIVKSSKNHKLNFETAVVSDDVKDVSLKVGHPLVTSKGNKISVDNFLKTLQPFEKCIVDFTVDCITEETIYEEIEIMVRDSQSLFV